MKALGIASLLALCAAAASAQKPEATLQRAVVAYRGAETVSVRFDQTVTNPLTDRSAQSRGELLRKRPNLLSITFSTPAADRIVADGTDLWVYLPSSAPGQVIKMPATGQEGLLLDPLGQILSNPVDHYQVTPMGTASVGGHDTHAVKLTPKAGRDLFTTATLWIDDADGAVRQVETTEPSGLVRRVTITQFRKNIPIPSSAFRFTPPANTRVVDQRGMIGG
ncbi:MAG: outer membrane lipoprotein chaperone LolA [Gemmatimonadaceae bacterium]